MTRLNLGHLNIDRSPLAGHLHVQLANHLRQLIASHDLAPGEEVPSESKLITATGLSRTAVREAIALLEREGLLVKKQGAATRVAEPPQRRRLDPLRYRQALVTLAEGGTPRTAFVEDHGATFEQYTISPCEVTRETATPQDIAYLGVRPGSKIVRRRFVERIDGRPMQIRRDALPYRLAGRTPMARAEGQPVRGGVLAELDAIGVTPTRWSELTTARMPTNVERELLELTLSPVWDVVSVFYVEDEAVIASRTIMPCSLNMLVSEGSLKIAAD